MTTTKITTLLMISALLLASLACQTVMGSAAVTATPDLDVTPTFPASGGEQPLGGSSRASQDEGLSRAAPSPPRTVVTAGTLEVEVLNYERGGDAWDSLRRTNQFNQPAPKGMEYVLVRIYVKNIAAGGEANEISSGDFRLTGDAGVRYFPSPVVPPDPALKASLAPGEMTTGWAAYLIPQGEGNLMVIVDQIEISPLDGEYFVYIALDEGNAIEPDESLKGGEATTLGTDIASPAQPGETVLTDSWEISIGEIIRGEDAWALIYAENQFNDPAPAGQEYILVWVTARFYGFGDEYGNIDPLDFSTLDANGDVYRYISVVDPEPDLDTGLFPGGQASGWVTVLADVDAQGLVLVFDAPVEDALRYFSLGE